VIEAIQLARDHSWVIGVQWHPEAMAAEDANQRRLFEALVEEARIRRSGRVSN
jgi:gamma-glutamyl-gamma-aminobutyrate hydrolase PuuD